MNINIYIYQTAREEKGRKPFLKIHVLIGSAHIDFGWGDVVPK